jgi:hypothetical protein
MAIKQAELESARTEQALLQQQLTALQEAHASAACFGDQSSKCHASDVEHELASKAEQVGHLQAQLEAAELQQLESKAAEAAVVQDLEAAHAESRHALEQVSQVWHSGPARTTMTSVLICSECCW